MRLMTGMKSAAAIALLSGVTGCAVHGDGLGHREHHEHSATQGIPKGHMPPPGECRIWYSNTPPGQQPPPGDCSRLRHDVPPGARLIRG
ncbi:hypothetical protein [Aidingimonas lacisalsi]|uniref:hypothetical protein n=1 Tax=Aidingimonas lacisalsi TaxID=2604086 RepID=UPI0011D28F64|nr:hypothetical protein [Aidingimonas lacisalsi]